LHFAPSENRVNIEGNFFTATGQMKTESRSPTSLTWSKMIREPARSQHARKDCARLSERLIFLLRSSLFHFCEAVIANQSSGSSLEIV
jgi:hypothetical protein